MSKPITPDEVKHEIPDKVIDVFNALIAENWNGQNATVHQSDAERLIAESMNLTSEEIFNQHLLDIESIYISAGWKVEYRKPDYNESPGFAPYFRFTK